jgi:hypothetical protein
VFIAEEVGGLRDKESGEKLTFQAWDYSPQVPDYQDSQIIYVGLNKFCCKLYMKHPH